MILKEASEAIDEYESVYIFIVWFFNLLRMQYSPAFMMAIISAWYTVFSGWSAIDVLFLMFLPLKTTNPHPVLLFMCDPSVYIDKSLNMGGSLLNSRGVSKCFLWILSLIASCLWAHFRGRVFIDLFHCVL